MCRFLVYKGTEPIQLDHLLTKPLHSITNQSYESRLRFKSPRPYNADGFGLGWYGFDGDVSSHASSRKSHSSSKSGEQDGPTGGGYLSAASSCTSLDNLAQLSIAHRPDEKAVVDGAVVMGVENEKQAREKLERMLRERERPCIFKSITPAWSNTNLERLAEKIRSPLVFAHVRASTMPGAPSEDNCHPWSFGKLMWMHNGEISGFPRIKRKLQEQLPEELYLFPGGYTDSEWAFMVFLSQLKDPHAHRFSSQELRTAMFKTLEKINALLKEAEVTSPSLMNFVVTDGETVVATRYVTSKTLEASSLFFSSGTTFEEFAEGGHYRMTKADKRENIIMIASEPLTFEQRDWMEVKTNTMVVITPKMNLLQIPIVDEYYVAPQHNIHRSSEFAISKGFGPSIDMRDPTNSLKATYGFTSPSVRPCVS